MENHLREGKKQLEEKHLKQTSELASKISAFEAAEIELKGQNKALLERLECEKQQFELRYISVGFGAIIFFSFIYLLNLLFHFHVNVLQA